MRTIIAGIIAGILIFVGGFLGHMMFGWVGRTTSSLPDEAGTIAHFESQKLSPGVYGFPEMPKDFATRTKDEQTKLWSEIGERYKTGPAALVIVAPSGEEMMDAKVLAKEFASNVVLGIVMAFIIAQIPGGFGKRFLIAVLMGFGYWLSINYSYHVWYRFPWAWTRDELFCSLFEAALAGIAIGLIVRGPKNDEDHHRSAAGSFSS